MEDGPGSGDCEQRLEVWGQPVLLASSSAYVLAGIFVVWWVWRRGASRGFYLFALGLVLTGLGSMDYHGPAVGPQPQLHDTGLALALIAAAMIDVRALGYRWRGPLAVVVALVLVVIVVLPDVTPGLAGLAASALVALELLVYRRGYRRATPALWSAMVALVVGGVLFALSRTGGPLCVPDSLLQGHAAWHVLTALALALWAVTAVAGEDGT